MTQTTNYQLPQWEASDPLRREDFNQAFAALDGVYGPEQKPYVYGTITVLYTTAQGEEVLTLDFEPHHVLIAAGGMTVLFQGGSGTIPTTLYYISNSGYVVALCLRKNKLTLGYFGSKVDSNVTVNYVAYR